MRATCCDCETAVDDPARFTDCDDCGSGFCRSCQINIDAQIYCRRCAAAFIAA